MRPSAASQSSRNSRCRAAAALAAFALAVGCTLLGACRSEPSKPANVVLITVDTLRADRLSPYGYEIDTVAIADLAARGIVYEKAFADTSWTLPSLSSVMTGTYPSVHGVRSWNDTLGEEQETIAELLRRHGYATAAIVGSYPLDRYFGFAQGFDHYDDEMTHALFADSEAKTTGIPEAPSDASDQARNEWRLLREKSNAYRTDREVADTAIAWLERNRQEPMFLWVHFFGPHEKGKRLDVEAEQKKAQLDAQIARYDPDVEEMDRQVGRLLAALRADPRYPNTAVLFHSDHGQSLKEHGLFGHGFDLYDTTVHVPLIVRLPHDRDAGERVARLVRNLDIFATVLELAGIDAPGERASRSLLAENPDDENHAYLETHAVLAFSARKALVGDRERNVGQILRGTRTDDFKLISREPFLAGGEDPGDPLPDAYLESNTALQLFDHRSDREEKKDVAGDHPDETAQLRELLDTHDAGRSESGGDSGELSESARERLRSLGYNP